MSISTVLGYRWDGDRSRLFFQTRKGSYNTESLIAFLEDLRRELRGKKVILVWDGLPAHKSRAMQDYLHAQRHWLTVERLPGYAPDLNPGGDAVVQHQRTGTGQPLCRGPGGTGRGRTRWHGASRGFRQVAVFLSATREALFLSRMSLYYARFSRCIGIGWDKGMSWLGSARSLRLRDRLVGETVSLLVTTLPFSWLEPRTVTAGSSLTLKH